MGDMLIRDHSGTVEAATLSRQRATERPEPFRQEAIDLLRRRDGRGERAKPEAGTFRLGMHPLASCAENAIER